MNRERRNPPLSDQLRLAIAECGISRYRIAKETGIHESTLSRFCRGQRGLSTAALDTLADFLRLRLVRGASSNH
jgi:transcriptional regulator with XRE-family HTH domain